MYTSILGVNKSKLEELYKKEVIEADRDTCEMGMDDIVGKSLIYFFSQTSFDPHPRGLVEKSKFSNRVFGRRRCLLRYHPY